MKKGHVLFFVTALMVSGLASCYYDNEEELYPNGCNTSDVTYSSAIVSIMEANCLSCHNNMSQNGNVNLEGYDNILEYVEDGSLIGSMRHDPGFSRMPQGTPKLSNCTIDRVQAWIDAGAPNN